MRPILGIVALCITVAACASGTTTTRSAAGAPGSATIAMDPTAVAARDELVAAERAFAARSTTSGTRDAFLAYLAEDAVLFIPRASPGRPFFEQQPPSISGLDWAPVYAEVAASGELGFTTGPYEARARAGSDSVTAWGNFVSIWRRDFGSNAWKVVVDLGTTNERPPASRRIRAVRGATVAARLATASAADAMLAPSSGAGAQTPLAADSAFSARAAADGTAAALAAASSDVRVHREGRQPIVGRAEAAAALRRERERFAWFPSTGVESRSGDLGYTYGTYGGVAPGAAEEGAYVRIWRRAAGGEWRLALDITNPFPR
jgi:ketosteroid isomerase-like protein